MFKNFWGFCPACHTPARRVRGTLAQVEFPCDCGDALNKDVLEARRKEQQELNRHIANKRANERAAERYARNQREKRRNESRPFWP